jgi:allantoinase
VTADGLGSATLLVKAGKIVEIGEWSKSRAADCLLDFGDSVLLPGLVDTHVHINEAGPEPGRTEWEGFFTATQAAAAGGVTTLVDMPLNCEPETISVAALEAKRAASKDKVLVDWMSWGGVVGNGSQGGNELEMESLIDAGVPGFKCFLVDSGIDGFAWADEAQLRKALTILRKAGSKRLPLLAHAEVAGPIDHMTRQINAAGDGDWRRYATYLSSRPDEAELEAIEMLISLSAAFDTPIHIVHLATARALPALARAKASGLKITVETCPHYLWFAAEDIPDAATDLKCAPPIRSAANREGLWQGLKDGIIDMVATDHSPCLPAMKRHESGRFDLAWGGIASLGLALAVVWSGLQQRGGELESLAKWLSFEPARLAGLVGQKGAIAVGYDADLVVFDPDTEWTVSENDLKFRHRVSPYLGARLTGRVVETYLRGQCIFRADDGRNRVSGELGGVCLEAHGRELCRTA